MWLRALASAAASFACTIYTASDPGVRTLSTLTCQKKHLGLIRRPTLAFIKDQKQGTAYHNYFEIRPHTAYMVATKSQTGQACRMWDIDLKYQKIETVGSNGLDVLHGALKSLSFTVIFGG